MNRLLIATLALSLLGAGFAAAQPNNRQNDVPAAVAPSSVGATDFDPARSASSSGALMHGGVGGQTVDEGTLLERRLAASGRTHGSYRAAPVSHFAARHHGRVSHERTGRGRHHHGRASHARAKHGHNAHGRAKASHARSRSHVHGHASSPHHRRHR